MAALYWLAQAAFLALLFLIPPLIDALPFSSDAQDTSTTTLLVGLALTQLGLVSWRLWISRSWLWVALLPPLSTAALWFATGPWAASEVGGDGRGLIAAMLAFGWCAICYVGVAIWAGLRPLNRSSVRTQANVR